MKKFKPRIRNRYFFLVDFIVFIIVPFICFTIRFDGFHFSIPILEIFYYAALFAVLKVVILYSTGIYSRWWENANIDDLIQIIFAGITILILQFALVFLFRHTSHSFLSRIPYSVSIFDSMISTFLITNIRLSPRISKSVSYRLNNSVSKIEDRVLIVGAGEAGVMVLGELRRKKKLETYVVGFIDNDPKKIGKKIGGVEVLGNRYEIKSLIIKYKIKKILIAMPSAAGSEIKAIVNTCNEFDNLEVLTLPPLYEILDGKIEFNKLRKVAIDDLLRRDPIKTELGLISDLISGKNILVTGAGGSIGSEICRQILRFNPAKLYILGHGENSIFEIEMELQRKFPGATIGSFIADIKDYVRLKKIFSENKINFIFHAAAHKHVPLMESHPYEAIRNNILGTKNIVDLAVEFDLEKLVLISTDKAVNPTSVMGTTKHIAEMIVINAAKKYKNKFSVVRFGNVLGSRGSVVKIFLSQIEKRSDITLTHPDVQRYFMTIPEAVQLVLQAFIMGNGGEIFVFDMGKPVKIIDLAHDLVRLSGLIAGEDINIITTGLKPGEKLYEELFSGSEKFNNTRNEKIFIVENSSKIIVDNFEYKLNELLDYVNSDDFDSKNCKHYLQALVPEYIPLNGNAKSLK
jgi:FlaA1/EpsC-like NDP-sugar epimerase